jgi:hypothetical protein
MMEGGQQQLAIEIVFDTGSDELKGIRGTLEIDIRDGKHRCNPECKFTADKKPRRAVKFD